MNETKEVKLSQTNYEKPVQLGLFISDLRLNDASRDQDVYPTVCSSGQPFPDIKTCADLYKFIEEHYEQDMKQGKLSLYMDIDYTIPTIRKEALTMYGAAPTRTKILYIMKTEKLLPRNDDLLNTHVNYNQFELDGLCVIHN
jgi:hypothetical protein